MSGHTKGPWSFNDGKAIFGKDVGDRICVVTTVNDETLKANAQLIAAAPDLLEALKALHRDIGTEQGYKYDESKLAERVRQAIAKAEESK